MKRPRFETIGSRQHKTKAVSLERMIEDISKAGSSSDLSSLPAFISIMKMADESPQRVVEEIRAKFLSSTSPKRVSDGVETLRLLLASSEDLREVTFTSISWLDKFLKLTVFSSLLKLKSSLANSTLKSIEKARASISDALSEWEYDFGQTYPLVVSACSRVRLAGWKVPNQYENEKTKFLNLSDESRVSWEVIETALINKIPEIESCINRLENALGIFFPKTLQEAFAGVVSINMPIGGLSISDSTSVSFTLNRDEILLANIREDFDQMKKKFSVLMEGWLKVLSKLSQMDENIFGKPRSEKIGGPRKAHEILQNLSKAFLDVENRVVLLISAQGSNRLLYDTSDNDFSDDF